MARLIDTQGPNSQYTRHVAASEDRDVAPVAREIFRKRVASHLVRAGVSLELVAKCADVFEATLTLCGSPDGAVAKTYDLIDGIFAAERIGACGSPLVDEIAIEWLSGNATKPIVLITSDVGTRLDDTVPRATRRAVAKRLIAMYREAGRRPFEAVVREEVGRLLAARKRVGKELGQALAGCETDLVEAWEESTRGGRDAVLSACADALIAAHRPKKSPMAKAILEARVHAS